MKDLLAYIIKNIIKNDNFEIEEMTDGAYTAYTVKVEPSDIAMVIGKGGRIIKSIRNIIKIRAIIEKKAVSLNISEK